MCFGAETGHDRHVGELAFGTGRNFGTFASLASWTYVHRITHIHSEGKTKTRRNHGLLASHC